MEHFTIGQVAKKTGVSIDAIRFYERENLIAPILRKTSGYRLFDESILLTVSFIRNAKGLGFTLAEIAELLTLRSNPGAISSDVKQKTSAKIVEIDDKIKRLQDMQNELIELDRSCDGQRLASECPILEGITSKIAPERSSNTRYTSACQANTK